MRYWTQVECWSLTADGTYGDWFEAHIEAEGTVDAKQVAKERAETQYPGHQNYQIHDLYHDPEVDPNADARATYDQSRL
jgi:hypothetical protein